jgi:alcohol dehydrogenase
MQALTYQGPRRVEALEMPEPTLPGPDAVLVQISTSGICGSDLHTFAGHTFVSGVGFTLGHEAVGRVVEVGADVRTVNVGDRVLIPASAGCAQCRNCQAGWVMRCTNGGLRVYGIGVGLDGLQAEAAAIRNADQNVVAIPDTIGDDAAVVLTDSLPTGWCGARQANVARGATVAVVGLGPVGLCAVMSAVELGAARVLAIDPLSDRRETAEKLGGEGISGDDVVGLIRDITDGHNADCVIEAVGSDTAIETAVQIAAIGGSVAIAGVPASLTLPIPIMQMFATQVSLNSALCSVQRELPDLIPLVEHGRLHPEQVVTHHFGLHDGARAYETFAERRPGTSKVVFTINGEQR